MKKNALTEQRLNKLNNLNEMNINCYPYKYNTTHTVKEINDNFDSFKLEEDIVKIAGRIILIRKMGKAMFAHLLDNDNKLQFYIRKDFLGNEEFKIFSKQIDIGDIVGLEGTLFKTHTNEKTLVVKKFKLLSKSLRTLPEKFHGLKDTEIRYRQRYVDLIVNPEVKEIFIKRSKIIKNIRTLLDNKSFLEVETPMMHSIVGGAAAKPFITHHNALNMELFLRIAPELYLKRLIVGGFNKVYEINRNFRNEGISTRHNPEFTMLELYSAYDDYNDMMDICEEIIASSSQYVNNSYEINYNDKIINVKPPFKRLPYFQILNETAGQDVSQLNIDELKNLAKEHNIKLKDNLPKIEIINEIFETLVEPLLFQPTFIIDYPIEISPLSKVHRDNPDLVERFELFIANQEIGNAYSELNDPIEQLNRFKKQLDIKEQTHSDEISENIDYDFIRALEYGMPPTGGLGIGIDRLVMILTGITSVREVILFPQLKKE